jgi:fumarate reductase subunit C
MKYLEQKPGHFWWTKNHRYTLYIVREFSAVLILVGLISIIVNIISNKIAGTKTMQMSLLDTIFGSIGFAGALIHSFTWLWVMPKISPVQLSKVVQIIAYFLLIIGTTAATIFAILYWINNS